MIEGMSETLKRYIERALNLPTGEIDRQNNKKVSDPEFVALMKVVEVFPWILEVADNKYDNNYAKMTLRIEAMKILREEGIECKLYRGEE